MIRDLCVSLIFPPSSTLCPASPSLGWVAWVSLPHLLDRLHGLRYYVQLRLPLHLLRSLRFWLASQYLCWLPFGLCPLRLAGRNGRSCSRLAFVGSGWPLSGLSPRGVGGSLKFPGYPFMHMPRSQSPVVSGCLPWHTQTLAFQSLQTVGFPRYHNGLSILSLWTTTIHFSEIGNAAYAFTTPGFIHTLLAMHAGSLQAWWLLTPGGIWTVSRPHPLDNINQFYDLHAEPKVLDLT